MDSFPATPLDVDIYSWQVLGAGDFAPAFTAEFAAHLDADRLNKALLLLLRAEPVLGCRIFVNSESARWVPIERLPDRPLMFTEDDVEYERLSTFSPDSSVGPQLSILLWRRPSSDVLVLKLAHASGDGASAIYCFERLAEIYTKLGEDPAYVPQPGKGRRDIEQIREALPKRVYLGVIRDWVTLLIGATWPRDTQHLGLRKGDDAPWRFLIRQLPVERVSALSQHARARGATLNDLFLAAYYRALASFGRWDGKAGLRTVCTVDLRRYRQDPRPDAVANLSGAEFPFLGRELGKSFDDTLDRVAAVMNKRKQRNPGLAISFLTPGIGKGLTEKRLRRTRKILEETPMPAFTNVGRLNGESLSFSGQIPVDAHFLCFKTNLPNLVFGMSGYQGTLTVSIAVADSVRPELEAFLDGILAELPA